MQVEGSEQDILEKRFYVLRDELIGKLKKSFESSTDNYGGLATRVVSNEWDGGDEALLIDNEGKWSGKSMMMGWEIGLNPPINRLLEIYADIKDPEYLLLNDEEREAERIFFDSEPESTSLLLILNRNPDEQRIVDDFHSRRNAVEEEWESKKNAFINEHKKRLLQGFIGALEQTIEDWL